jgi:hypothetical protein
MFADVVKTWASTPAAQQRPSARATGSHRLTTARCGGRRGTSSSRDHPCGIHGDDQVRRDGQPAGEPVGKGTAPAPGEDQRAQNDAAGETGALDVGDLRTKQERRDARRRVCASWAANASRRSSTPRSHRRRSHASSRACVRSAASSSAVSRDAGSMRRRPSAVSSRWIPRASSASNNGRAVESKMLVTDAATA